MAKKKTKTLDQLYMTAHEVSELFHVCPRTVWRWREAGKIHGVKVGREYRFPVSEVTALMDKHEAAEVRAIMQARANGKKGA